MKPLRKPAWSTDPRDAHGRGGRGDQHVLRVDGGEGRPVCTVTWRDRGRANSDPNTLHLRQTVLAELLALPAYRPRATRTPNPDALVACGATVLDDLTNPPPVARPWVVRVYYMSMADEQCYAEFGNLTEDRAREIARTAGQDKLWHLRRASDVPEGQVWSVRRSLKPCGPRVGGTCRGSNGKLRKKSERASCPICAGVGKIEVPIPAPLDGWREVVFPSERTGVVVESVAIVEES